MLRQGFPHQAPARLTLVMEKGNVSLDHFTLLTKAQCSFLAAIPAAWGRSFAQVALRQCHPLTLPDGRRIKVYAQADTRLGGMDGKLLVSFSPPCYRQQVRTLDLLQQKADQQLHALRASIQDAIVRKRPRTEGAVRRAMHQLVRHDRLNDFFSPTLLAHSPGRPGGGSRPPLAMGYAEKTAHQASRLWQNGALDGPPGTQRSTHGGGLPPAGKGRSDVSHPHESAPGAVVASASLDGQHTVGPCPLLFCRAVVDSHRVASAPRPPPCHRCGNPYRTPSGHAGGPGGVCQRGSAAGDDRAQPTAGGTLCCPRLTNPSTAVG